MKDKIINILIELLEHKNRDIKNELIANKNEVSKNLLREMEDARDLRRCIEWLIYETDTQ